MPLYKKGQGSIRLVMHCFVMVLAAFLLSGCSGGDSSGEGSGDISGGDGSGDNTSEIHGVFIGPVQGLHYETESGSGLTNSKGEFVYLSGETVTFSIGGIELGAAPAAAEISIFDLFDMHPPASEPELRAELLNAAVSDFDRVANITYLLVALDSDRDPYNGLDLSGWDESLTAASLSFDKDMFSFATPGGEGSLIALGHSEGINFRGLDITEPLTYLYDALGIVVSVSMEVREEHDSVGDGEPNRWASYAYDGQGRLSDVERSDELSGSGLFTRNRASYVYGDAGRLLSKETLVDVDGDGLDDNGNKNTYSYNLAGSVVTDLFEADSGLDGKVDFVVEVSNTYGNAGELLESAKKASSDGVVQSLVEYSYSYDVYGNRTGSETKSDFDGDGVPDKIDTATNSHDIAGRLWNSYREIDSDGDGTVDLVLTEKYSYDDAGRILSEILEVDSDADSALDRIESEESQYDSYGNRVSKVYLVDQDADGLYESRNVYTVNVDSDGYLTDALYEIDKDGDSQVDQRSYYSFTFDEDGNWTHRKIEYDLDADGVIDRLNTYAISYDEFGNILSTASETDTGVDGTLDTVNYRTYTYSASSGTGVYYLIDRFRYR